MLIRLRQFFETLPPLHLLIRIKLPKKHHKDNLIKYERMKTRSQTKKEQREQQECSQNINVTLSICEDEYPVIDFDEASREWRSNKIQLKNGCFRYKKERIVKK
jgi:hypothetical protein